MINALEGSTVNRSPNFWITYLRHHKVKWELLKFKALTIAALPLTKMLLVYNMPQHSYSDMGINYDTTVTRVRRSMRLHLITVGST